MRTVNFEDERIRLVFTTSSLIDCNIYVWFGVFLRVVDFLIFGHDFVAANCENYAPKFTAFNETVESIKRQGFRIP